MRYAQKVLGIILMAGLALTTQSANVWAWGNDHNHGRGHYKRHNSYHRDTICIPERSRHSHSRPIYKRHTGLSVIINIPIGTVVTSIPLGCRRLYVNGDTYYHHNDIYYTQRPYGYLVVPDPVTERARVSIPSTNEVESLATHVDVNIPNNNGSYTTVTITKSGSGYVGPQGEFYADFPKVAELKLIYGS